MLNMIVLVFLMVIHLSSQNDCKFDSFEKQVFVFENTTIGTELFSVVAFPRRQFSIQETDGSKASGYFSFTEIDRRHVSIQVSKSLEDLNDQSSPITELRFQLACRGRDSNTSYLPVTVFVEDINDNDPIFTSEVYNVAIEENTRVGMTIFRGIKAIDRDNPNSVNSRITYEIISGNDGGKFSIEGKNSIGIVLRKQLDYESSDRNFNLTIIAKDGGTPSRTATCQLIIDVKDVDDMSPKFTSAIYKASIEEDVTPALNRRKLEFNKPILAVDQDLMVRDKIIYEISEGNDLQLFEIDSFNGSIYLAKLLDREELQSGLIVLKIVARQENNQLKSASALLEINVIDLNDNRPEFEVEKYNMSVVENLPKDFEIMQFIAIDKDQGENSVFSYVLNDPLKAFSLNKNGSLTLKYPELFDREKTEKVTLEVFAVEKKENVIYGNKSSHVKVDIFLLDANDNSPYFIPNSTYEFTVSKTTDLSEAIGSVKAVDLDTGNNANIRYKLKNPSDLSPWYVDERNGNVFMKPGYNIVSDRMSFLIEASDQPDRKVDEKTVTATIIVKFLDSVKNETFQFSQSLYEWWTPIANESENGKEIGRVMVQSSGFVIYTISHTHNFTVPFKMEPESGRLTLNSDIHTIWQNVYDLQVFANNTENIIESHIKVHVKDQEIKDVLYYAFDIKENTPGQMIANFSDVLHKLKKEQEHLLVTSDSNVDFYLTDDGGLFSPGRLDREEKDSYDITIFAGRKGFPRGFREKPIIQIKINVTDDNDCSPYFEHHIYHGYVDKKSQPGTEVTLSKGIQVIDPDLNDTHGVNVFLYGKGSEHFELNVLTGQIFLSNISLGDSVKDVYYLRVKAVDSANHEGEGQVIIRVSDKNQFSANSLKLQVLDRKIVTIDSEFVDDEKIPVLNISETIPPGTKIAKVISDVSINLEFEISSEKATHLSPRVNEPAEDRFFVEKSSGELIVKRQVEANTKYELAISTRLENDFFTTAKIVIKVNDINNHKPVFDQRHYVFKLLEGTYSQKSIGSIHATDNDFSKNSEIIYSLVTESDDPKFHIDRKSGIVSVSGDVDFEKNEIFKLTFRATDHGERPLSSYINATVEVIDTNDNQPLFLNYDRLMEAGGFHTIPVYTSVINVPVLKAGTEVKKIFAEDSDSEKSGNGLIGFKLLNGQQYFYIHPTTGLITSLKNIGENWNITIEAADHGNPVKSTKAILSVVLDVPNQDKEVSLQGNPREEPSVRGKTYLVQVSENIKAPKKILSLQNDSEENQSYQIVGNTHNLFSINEKNGDVYVIQELDREQKETYFLHVKVQKKNQDTIEKEIIIRINVLDVNDNSPKFSKREFWCTLKTSDQVGTTLTSLQAFDQDKGYNSSLKFSFKEKNELLKLDEKSGEITLRAGVGMFAGKIFDFVVLVRDRFGDMNSLYDTAMLRVCILDEMFGLDVITNKVENDESADNQTVVSKHFSQITNMKVVIMKTKETENKRFLTMFAVKGDKILAERELRKQLVLKQVELNGTQILYSSSAQNNLGYVEIAVLTIACIVFLGGFLAVVCICCLKLNRAKKKFPAPLAVPLPKFTMESNRNLTNQENLLFGPNMCSFNSKSRRSVRSQSVSKNSLRNESLETDYLSKSTENSRSRDSGIDDNKETCSCDQSSLSSRSTYNEEGFDHCHQCCECVLTTVKRRHRSSSPIPSKPSRKDNCFLYNQTHSRSHHDLRYETETDSDYNFMSSSSRRKSSSSSRKKPIYTEELWSRSLTPAQSDARMSLAELRLASTTARRGQSWRGEMRRSLKNKK